MGYSEFKGKTVEEALTAASIELGVASTDIDFEVIDKGSSGFLGLGAKQAVIRAKKKDDNVVVKDEIKTNKTEVKKSESKATNALANP